MIGNYQLNPDYTVPEKFFAERLAELLFHKTIDSHRVKLNNPRSSLQEVKYLLTDFAHKKIKHFDKTVKPVVEEAQALLKGDKTLKYDQIDKAYYDDLLGSVKPEDYQSLFHATNLVLKGNQDYFSSLCNAISDEISRLVAIPAPIPLFEFLGLEMLTGYLGTEMVNSGYSKNYLSKKIIAGFEQSRATPFQTVFNKVKGLAIRPLESFDVIFRLMKKEGGTHQINLQDSQVLNDHEINELCELNVRARQFFSKRGARYWYLKISQEGCDFFAVVERAKRHLLPKMDVLHMGFPDAQFSYNDICLVIGNNEPTKTTTHPIKFISDGYYRNHQDVYDILQQNLYELSTNKNIQKETIQKIVSAVRHLRLGSESDELEQVFLNYWIGLEYIFSNYDAGESTIVRLKENFINAHTLSYMKRNLIEFFKDMKRLEVESLIPGYNIDLQFLKDEKTYDHIMGNFLNDHPLLAFRAYEYKRLLVDNKIRGFLAEHRIQLDRHLTRCYRFRNEIVHDAAIHLNIDAITANLKYYLTFVINDIIAFLKNNPMDLNLSGYISIEDYFIYKGLKIKGLEKTGFTFNKMLDEVSVTEAFS